MLIIDLLPRPLLKGLWFQGHSRPERAPKRLLFLLPVFSSPSKFWFPSKPVRFLQPPSLKLFTAKFYPLQRGSSSDYPLHGSCSASAGGPYCCAYSPDGPPSVPVGHVAAAAAAAAIAAAAACSGFSGSSSGCAGYPECRASEGGPSTAGATVWHPRGPSAGHRSSPSR